MGALGAVGAGAPTEPSLGAVGVGKEDLALEVQFLVWEVQELGV